MLVAGGGSTWIVAGTTTRLSAMLNTTITPSTMNKVCWLRRARAFLGIVNYSLATLISPHVRVGYAYRLIT